MAGAAFCDFSGADCNDWRYANDTLMFAPSGLSIAMGNASAEVQAKAKQVTTSNEDEGFANAVERFILPLS